MWKKISNKSHDSILGFKTLWLKKLKYIPESSTPYYFVDMDAKQIEDDYFNLKKGLPPSLSTQPNHMEAPVLDKKEYQSAFKSAIKNMDDSIYLVTHSDTNLFTPTRHYITDIYIYIIALILLVILYGCMVDNKKQYIINISFLTGMVILLFYSYLII
jgi:hypothetical protein